MRKSILVIAVVLLLGALSACSVFTSRRGFHRSMVDHNIQLTAQRALDRDPQLIGHVHIGTEVYNGVLMMIGEAETEADKARAEVDVSNYESVRRVVNLIEVMPLQSAGRTLLDASVTARVKTALLGISALPDFDPGRVKVSTAHAKVYLMGLVTHQEAEAVVAVARNVAGVHEVVQVFEYIE